MTTSSFTTLRQGSLRIGSPPGRLPQKRTVATLGPGKGARLALLEDPKPRWGSFGTSVLLQIAGAALLVALPMFFPEKLIPKMRYEIIPLVTPLTEVPLPPEPPKVRAKIQPRPEPVETPVEPPKLARLVAPPKPVAPKPKRVEVLAPELKAAFQPVNINTPRNEPPRPREEVKTGVLSTGSAAPATVNHPLNQVQTGGFGDPNGLPGPGDPNKRANIARKGSPDLPGGPGYGNGTGGANGVRGTVASTGFGNGIAVPPSGGPGNGGRGTVKQTGFDASAAPEAPKARAAAAAPAVTPVEILAKPNPVYTEEARKRRIEGEVLVEVVFLASGEIRVGRVIRSLGFGLDEAALRAAQQIRFKPAKREGQPVDFPATVHIVFQMAY